METILSTLLDIQLDFIEVMIIGLSLFSAGYWLGGLKSRKLNKKIGKMERDIMDLNAELLYNNH